MTNMKNISRIFLAGVCVLVCTILVGGCRKAPINGKLDGQWQIMKIELTDDGTVTTPEWRAYIDINLHVVNLTTVTTAEVQGDRVCGNLIYDKSASTMTLDFPYNTEGSKLERLKVWGIYSNPVTFDIVKVNGKELVIRSARSIVTCRRY